MKKQDRTKCPICNVEGIMFPVKQSGSTIVYQCTRCLHCNIWKKEWDYEGWACYEDSFKLEQRKEKMGLYTVGDIVNYNEDTYRIKDFLVFPMSDDWEKGTVYLSMIGHKGEDIKIPYSMFDQLVKSRIIKVNEKAKEIILEFSGFTKKVKVPWHITFYQISVDMGTKFFRCSFNRDRIKDGKEIFVCSNMIEVGKDKSYLYNVASFN